MEFLRIAAEEETFRDFRVRKPRHNKFRRMMRASKPITIPHSGRGGFHRRDADGERARQAMLDETARLHRERLKVLASGPLSCMQAGGRQWWKKAADYFRQWARHTIVAHPFSAHHLQTQELTLAYHLGIVDLAFNAHGNLTRADGTQHTQRRVSYWVARTNFEHGYERTSYINAAMQKAEFLHQNDIVIVLVLRATEWTATTSAIPGQMTPVDVTFPFQMDSQMDTLTVTSRTIGTMERISCMQALSHMKDMVERRRKDPQQTVTMCAISHSRVWTEIVPMERGLEVDRDLLDIPSDDTEVNTLAYRVV